ncbi:MAG: proprotein convertase P-domain-containing protein [Flavobacteriaceae bacterium]|nr:proprotein convertase P-domain-containing protein [Flavobacteriaceae bacterium]
MKTTKLHFKQKLLVCIVLVLTAFTFSHAQNRTCGMEQHMSKLLKNPDFAKAYAKRQAAFNLKFNEIKTQKTNGTYQKKATLYIPVAVHFPAGSEANRACLESLAQSQIDVLNEDYKGTNADLIAKWPTFAASFPGVTTGTTDVKFCIATKNHPTVSPAIADGSLAVTIGSTQSGTFATTDNNTSWVGYMNFNVKDVGAGILGYSPLGGSISAGNSVAINTFAFGKGITNCTGYVPAGSSALGRTVTHELGHFYNLDHTFNGGCAGAGDSVADTPAVASEKYGCVNTPAGLDASCVASQKALRMNFMDYADDPCMWMFTAGQSTRMEAYFATVASDWKTNVISCQSPDFTVTATNSPVAVCAPTNGVFNFTFGISNGYNTTTTLSVTGGLPAGATAVFSPTSMNAAGNFTLTLTGTIAAGNYPMTISAAGTTTKTVDIVLSVQAGIPTVPTLTTPTNGATGQAMPTNLVWATSANAATYTVETATDAGFTANTTSNSVSTTNYSATGLTQATQYFWRVKAVNGCGESTYSSVFNFTTATISCNTGNNNTSVAIPNSTTNGTEAAPGVSTIVVSNNVTITDVNVTVNITYGYVEDLRLVLTSPTGTTIELLKNLASNSGANFTNTVFDDAGTTAITATAAANAPFTATYSPENPLSVVNGQASVGNWTLSVYDNWTDDSGTINSWSIEICGSPVLAIEDTQIANSFALWPNPNNGEFHISFNTTNNDAVALTAYDIRGRKVTEQRFENNSKIFNQTVNFNMLAKGVYILKIQTGNNEFFKRLVIK